MDRDIACVFISEDWEVKCVFPSLDWDIKCYFIPGSRNHVYFHPWIEISRYFIPGSRYHMYFHPWIKISCVCPSLDRDITLFHPWIEISRYFISGSRYRVYVHPWIEISHVISSLDQDITCIFISGSRYHVYLHPSIEISHYISVLRGKISNSLLFYIYILLDIACTHRQPVYICVLFVLVCFISVWWSCWGMHIFSVTGVLLHHVSRKFRSLNISGSVALQFKTSRIKENVCSSADANKQCLIPLR